MSRHMRHRRQKLTPKQERFSKAYDVAHETTRVIGTGIAEELKRDYSPEEYRATIGLIDTLLKPALFEEERTWNLFQKSLPKRKPSRVTVRRNPR